MKTVRAILVTALISGALLLATAANACADDYAEIPVPNGIVYAGQQISASMLTLRKVPAKYLLRAGVYARTDDLLGMVARTTLLPARPIQINQVVEPDVVKASVPAMMHYHRGNLRISAEVQPLNSAKAGEIVRVRTRFSNAVITGVAEPDGSIRAGFTPQAGH